MAQQLSQQHWDVPIRRGDPCGKQPPLHPTSSLQVPLDSPVDAPLGIDFLDSGVLRVVVLHLRVAQLCPVDVDEDGGAARGVSRGGPAPDLTGASPGAEIHNPSELGQEGGKGTWGQLMLPVSPLPRPLSPSETAGRGKRERRQKRKKKKTPRNETKGSRERLSSS